MCTHSEFHPWIILLLLHGINIGFTKNFYNEITGGFVVSMVVSLNKGDFRSLMSFVVKNELGMAVKGTGV